MLARHYTRAHASVKKNRRLWPKLIRRHQKSILRTLFDSQTCVGAELLEGNVKGNS
jgi:hypothetical protein